MPLSFPCPQIILGGIENQLFLATLDCKKKKKKPPLTHIFQDFPVTNEAQIKQVKIFWITFGQLHSFRLWEM